MNVTEVVAVEVDDRPGGLVRLLECLESSGINIEYMYAFTFGREGRAVLIFRFDQPDAAIERLRGSGINVLGAPRDCEHRASRRRTDGALLVDPPHVRDRHRAAPRARAPKTSSISPWAIPKWSRPRP